MTVLAEWVYDERGSAASNVWSNELFISSFLSFNEIAGTELTVGLLTDLEHDHRALNVEFKRRLSDSCVIRLECNLNLKSDPVDVTYDGRRGSFLGIDLNFNFRGWNTLFSPFPRLLLLNMGNTKDSSSVLMRRHVN